MGPKITIDSATMANKGLEVIEAKRLFGLPPESIRVLIHPQSIVHSLVRTRDLAQYAQLSHPDMELPIQNALTWPELLPVPVCRLDLAGRELSFSAPDTEKYPLLNLAYEAAGKDGPYPAVYNAANETAVRGFIEGKIGFTDIALLVESVLSLGWELKDLSIQAIVNTDREVRLKTGEIMKKRKK
jgi:1-deoxy-D-xylulose-5-phosphate reductoisomerase